MWEGCQVVGGVSGCGRSEVVGGVSGCGRGVRLWEGCQVVGGVSGCGTGIGFAPGCAVGSQLSDTLVIYHRRMVTAALGCAGWPVEDGCCWALLLSE